MAPELTERRMTPVGGQPPPPSDRRSSQERPRSKFSVDCLKNNFPNTFFAIFLIDVLVVAFLQHLKMSLCNEKRPKETIGLNSPNTDM